jgi:hypothetical protein
MSTDRPNTHPPNAQPRPLAPANRKRFIKWAIAVIAGLLLIGAFLPALHTIYWIGRRNRTLVFSIVDSVSNAAVAKATITVFQGPSEIGVGMPPPEPDESDPRTQSFSMDENGRAESSYEFEAHGHKNRFTDWGRVRFGDRYVRVTADGYDPLQFRLGERIGELGDIHDKSPIRVEVKLKRARTNRAAGAEQ